MKAYKVSSEFVDVSIIAFGNTANEAKTNALSNEWFEDDEYVNLRARREKWADNLNKANILCLDFCDNSNLYHKNGWCCYSEGDCDKDCVFHDKINFEWE